MNIDFYEIIKKTMLKRELEPLLSVQNIAMVLF